MRTLLLLSFVGLVDVTFGTDDGVPSVSEIKETVNKVRLDILNEEGEKIDSKLKDFLKNSPTHDACLNMKASEAKENIKWALEMYIDPFLAEIAKQEQSEPEASGKSPLRQGRRQDYYKKYIEERAKSAMTYAQTEAEAASRSFASGALNC